MPRLVAVLSGLLCATNALRPQTRHQFLQNVVDAVAAAPLAGAALLPAAATASTRDYTPADEDMKGLLSSFTTELGDKEAAAAQKKIDDGTYIVSTTKEKKVQQLYTFCEKRYFL